jgi:polyvinyl alcohol dehydrogenase (cytochrome)
MKKISIASLMIALSASFSGSLFGQNLSTDPAIGGEPFGGQANAWKSWGNNLHNTHSSFAEHRLVAGNVGALAVKWTFVTAGEVSATPTVEDDAVYVPDWAGYIYKIDARTGVAVWTQKLSKFTGVPSSLSRNAPLIAGSLLIFGDQASGTVMAIDKFTGSLLWLTIVDPHPAARITGSPIVFGDRVYVGVASREESDALDPGYQFSFRGSVRALDLTTGAVIWTAYTVPSGYTGAAVWGTFALDTVRGALYASTGNNYSIPDSATSCLQSAAHDVNSQLACLDPQDYVDSVLSISLSDGHINWGRRFQGADTFIYTCAVAAAQGDVPCPNPPGPDYDLGAGPNMFSITQNGRQVDVVGAGQKSGVYWAMNADTGTLLWSTQVGPGGLFGGIEWGPALDANRIYVAISNYNHVSYTVGPPSNETLYAGSWAALDSATGAILWQVPTTGQDPRAPQYGSLALGQVSEANGVVYAGSTAGDMVALDAGTGQTLWKFASGGTVICGPAIVNGTIYWGSGYSRLGVGTTNNKLYAFTVNSPQTETGE